MPPAKTENADIKQLSILGSKSLGDMSYLVPLLAEGRSCRSTRRLAAIRSYTAMGPEAAGRVREQLVEEFGEETASVAGKMLVGFRPRKRRVPSLSDN